MAPRQSPPDRRLTSVSTVAGEPLGAGLRSGWASTPTAWQVVQKSAAPEKRHDPRVRPLFVYGKRDVHGGQPRAQKQDIPLGREGRRIPGPGVGGVGARGGQVRADRRQGAGRQVAERQDHHIGGDRPAETKAQPPGLAVPLHRQHLIVFQLQPVGGHALAGGPTQQRLEILPIEIAGDEGRPRAPAAAAGVIGLCHSTKWAGCSTKALILVARTLSRCRALLVA